MIKLLLTVLTSLMCTSVFANQSVLDIKAMLNDDVLMGSVADSEIQSITNDGDRNYTLTFGSCMAQVSVVSNCLPGGDDQDDSCVEQVQFNSANVNCLP